MNSGNHFERPGFQVLVPPSCGFFWIFCPFFAKNYDQVRDIWYFSSPPANRFFENPYFCSDQKTNILGIFLEFFYAGKNYVPFKFRKKNFLPPPLKFLFGPWKEKKAKIRDFNSLGIGNRVCWIVWRCFLPDRVKGQWKLPKKPILWEDFNQFVETN